MEKVEILATKRVLGWAGVSLTLIISGIWAVWGSIENFHEGWYSTSLLENIGMFLFQYLLFCLVFVILGLVSLRFKRIGLILHLAVMAGSAYFFRSAVFSVLGLFILLPLGGLAMLYFFGEPAPRKWAFRVIWMVPLLIILAISVPRLISTSARVNDGDFGTRIVEGNGVTLVWAPRGPGWPDKGTSWTEAERICRFLSEDGATLCSTPQNYWRLPTVEEAVASMSLHNQNAGGVWNEDTETAAYVITPDKETPLWDVHSKVIYYWTADTAPNEQQAYIIVYHGGVYTREKTHGQAYLSFRAVQTAGKQ